MKKTLKNRQDFQRFYHEKLAIPCILTIELLLIATFLYLLTTAEDTFSFKIAVCITILILHLLLTVFFVRDYWYGIYWIKKVLTNTPSAAKTVIPLFLKNSYSIAVIHELQDRIKKDTNAETLTTNAKLFALQSQINPHFLYNTFDTIRSIAIEEDISDIAEMTEALGSMFRYNISRPGEIATLSEEIENSKNYLIIQQYRFPDKFTVEWKLEEGEDILRFTLPVLTIQPILENAIHHGLEPIMGTGKITVRIWTTDSKLIISVEDSGAGISDSRLRDLRKQLDQNFFEGSKNKSDTKQKKGRNGIALANVHQRIQLYFGENYGLEIYSTEGVGTSVHIILPKYDRKV